MLQLTKVFLKQRVISIFTHALHRCNVRVANDILLWRDPKKSAVCVVGSTATWAILTFSGLTPLVLCARLLTVVFFATWFWHAAAKVLGRCVAIISGP